MFLGPALSGSLVQGIGFQKMLIGIAIICFLYGPLLFALKEVPPRTQQEKQETSVSISLGKIASFTFLKHYLCPLVFPERLLNYIFIVATDGRWYQWNQNCSQIC